MQEAMHAARLVAAQSALLALLTQQRMEHMEGLDGVTVSLSQDAESGCSLDVIYTDKGRPVAGEGM